MARNREVIRQWSVLRALDAARNGLSVADLAAETGVSKRTTWRDLSALQEAGFPLFDEKRDGHAVYRLDGRPIRLLAEKGLSLTQLCALYFSRELVGCLAGTPFHDDLRSAFELLESTLTARMRGFLDQLPGVLAARAGPVKRRNERAFRETMARLLDATLNDREVDMRYFSFASGRTKDYRVHPYRLVHAHGGFYLVAFVPEYGETRTFAVERIRRLAARDATFDRPAQVPIDPFSKSLGVHNAETERVELEFDAHVAPYIRERVWHPSQRLRDGSDGTLRLTLDVAVDWALRSWVLSFGPFVRVASPAHLAEDILEQLEEARAIYAPRMAFELDDVPLPAATFSQPPLPLAFPWRT